MKMALIPGLYFKSYTRFTEARIPFETLALCGTVEATGVASCEVVDFNIRCDSVRAGATSARFPGLPLDSSFYDRAAASLVDTQADIFLFAISIHTNGNLFHSLRIAGRLRDASPRAIIVFSGLGASSRHEDVLTSYPAVDCVVRGEAEATVAELVTALAEIPAGEGWRAQALERLAGLDGLSLRKADGTVLVNGDRKLIEDLDVLAMPPLGLYGQVISEATRAVEGVRYLSVEEHIHLEAGRGCPFSCTFCSNTYLWRRRYRLKSPDRLVAEIEAAKALGGRKFLLHQQLFTANKVKTRAFCEALIAKGLDIEWSCFTRTDCVSEDLLAVMKQSGCNTIMFGIESGSQRLQNVVRKKADLARMREQIEMTIRSGIKPQLSYIIGFPDETREELQATFDMYCDYKFRDNVESQIGLLVPAGGTEMFDENLENLDFDGVQTTTWYTRFFDQDSYGEMEAHPRVFPQNHYVKTEYLTREFLHFVKIFDIAASYLRRSCKYAVLRQLASFPYEAYDLYLRWKADDCQGRGAAHRWDGKLNWDTELLLIVEDFADFLTAVIAPRDDEPGILQGMVAFELGLAQANQVLREQTWEEICAFAPADGQPIYSGERMIDAGIDVDEAFDLIDAGDIQAAASVPRQASSYRIIPESHSKLRIDCLSAPAREPRYEDIFRQVEF